MARVILHCGFHKTGTTTIQAAIQAADPAVLLTPRPEWFGPGHALIAWRARGKSGAAPEPDILLRAVSEAIGPTPRPTLPPVVISSEALAGVVMPGDDRRAVQRLVDAHEVELVMTIADIRTRFLSALQQNIRAGLVIDPLDDAAIDEFATSRFEGAKDQLIELVDSFGWAASHLVISSKSDPEHLFRSFETIIGGPLPRLPPQNESWPSTAIDRILHLNRLLGPAASLRDILPGHDGPLVWETSGPQEHLARAWLEAKFGEQRRRQRLARSGPGEVGPPFSLPISERTEHRLARLWEELLGEIATLERSGRAKVHRPMADGGPALRDTT